MSYIFVAGVCLAFLVSSVFVIGGFYTSFYRPHRSKIFFSYSHKDTEIAKKVLEYLKKYHFRVWIDFGITIPTADLEKDLRDAIEKSELIILLASVNSVRSTWVQFEIAEAQKKSRLRHAAWIDMAILALDDWGIQLHQSLMEFNEEQMQQHYASSEGTANGRQSLNTIRTVFSPNTITSENDQDKGVKLASKVLGSHSSLTRVFVRTVTLYDLRDSFVPALQQLSDGLSKATRFSVRQVGCFNVLRVCLLLFWLFVMASSAFVLFLILTRVD